METNRDIAARIYDLVRAREEDGKTGNKGLIRAADAIRDRTDDIRDYWVREGRLPPELRGLGMESTDYLVSAIFGGNPAEDYRAKKDHKRQRPSSLSQRGERTYRQRVQLGKTSS